MPFPASAWLEGTTLREAIISKADTAPQAVRRPAVQEARYQQPLSLKQERQPALTSKDKTRKRYAKLASTTTWCLSFLGGTV